MSRHLIETGGRHGRRRAPFQLLGVMCASCLGISLLAGVTGAGGAARSRSGGLPSPARVLFILCNWGSGFSYHPNSLPFYRTLWTNPTSGGFASLADYWRQVSFGQTTINGSAVLDGPHSHGGWYSMSGGSSPITPVTYAGYGGGGSPQRIDRIFECMDAASADLPASTFTHYRSIVTVSPYVQAIAPSAISNGATTIKLSSVSAWPSARFDINFTPPNSNSRNYTDVLVTSINTSTRTLRLARPWSLGAVKAGALITSVTSDDVGIVGQRSIWESGSTFNNSGSGTAYSIGLADLSAGDPAHGSVTNGVGDGAHEVGHSFGYQHSRTMATSVTDYNDCWDQMSYNACGDQSPNTEVHPIDPAVGLDAIDLENQGWVPGAAIYQYTGAQHTVRLHALSDPSALSGSRVPLLDAHIPALVRIEDGAPSGSSPSVPPRCTGTGFHCDVSDYFTVEYRQARSPSGTETWDFGAGRLTGRSAVNGAVVLHLHTPVPNPTGGNSFLVDTNLNAKKLATLANNGALAPSLGSAAKDEFVDAATHTYVAVNAIDTSTWTATVTISSRPIATSLTYIGPTTVTYGQKVALSARVTVAGSGALVPNEPVLFAVADGLACHAKTDLSGVARCSVSMTQSPESGNPSFNVDAQFNGDAAYAGIYMLPRRFTIKKAALSVTAKSVSRPQGTPNPSLSAVLSGFVLGQSIATSGVTGSARCTTTATTGSAAGTYPITCAVGTLRATNYAFSRFILGVLTVT